MLQLKGVMRNLPKLTTRLELFVLPVVPGGAAGALPRAPLQAHAVHRERRAHLQHQIHSHNAGGGGPFAHVLQPPPPLDARADLAQHLPTLVHALHGEADHGNVASNRLELLEERGVGLVVGARSKQRDVPLERQAPAHGAVSARPLVVHQPVRGLGPHKRLKAHGGSVVEPHHDVVRVNLGPVRAQQHALGVAHDGAPPVLGGGVGALHRQVQVGVGGAGGRRHHSGHAASPPPSGRLVGSRC
mmetsp:Transcript_20008/g.38152  ORF Transcript_20008/g.38152 Transcript_20008/m.38152 type:complete len:244 (+) Transcript_20008:910-1641(+)